MTEHPITPPPELVEQWAAEHFRSLKEQSLQLLKTYNTSGVMLTAPQADTIRRALAQPEPAAARRPTDRAQWRPRRLPPQPIASRRQPTTTQPMTKQHKATPEQWAQIEHTAQDIHGDGCWALLELRARVELLETTQHAHIDTSDQIRHDLARSARVFATAEVAPIVAPSSPAGSLVDRVAKVIYDAPVTEAGWRNEARAAILEVAAWLVEQAPEPGPVGKWLGQISTPEAVMADMLRYEANR